MARIILFILFFYLIYFLVKNLFLKPSHQNAGSAKSRGFRSPFQKKEGDVTIEYDAQNPPKREDKKVGEYVDYEEVKEGKN